MRLGEGINNWMSTERNKLGDAHSGPGASEFVRHLAAQEGGQLVSDRAGRSEVVSLEFDV